MDLRLVQGGLALLSAVALGLSWQWGYGPARRAAEDAQRARARLTADISTVEAVVARDGTIAAWLAAHEQQLARLKSRVPEPAQLPTLLNAIVDTVKSGELKLVNVEQGNMEPVADGSAPLSLNGRPCYRLPMTVTAEGRYRELLRALEQLMSEPFPLVVGLERVEMRLQDPLAATLNAVLHLSLYVAGAPAAPPSP